MRQQATAFLIFRALRDLRGDFELRVLRASAVKEISPQRHRDHEGREDHEVVHLASRLTASSVP